MFYFVSAGVWNAERTESRRLSIVACSCNLWVSPILQIALFSLCNSTSIFIRTQHEYSYSDPVKAKWFLSKSSDLLHFFFAKGLSCWPWKAVMSLGFVFFLQKRMKSFMLLSPSWLLISSGALPLERWWKFGIKKPGPAPAAGCECGSAAVCRSLSSLPVLPLSGAGQGRGPLPQPCPGHCRPALKLRAGLQGELQIKTRNSTAKVLNYLKSTRLYRVWIEEMGQTVKARREYWGQNEAVLHY